MIPLSLDDKGSSDEGSNLFSPLFLQLPCLQLLYLQLLSLKSGQGSGKEGATE